MCRRKMASSPDAGKRAASIPTSSHIADLMNIPSGINIVRNPMPIARIIVFIDSHFLLSSGSISYILLNFRMIWTAALPAISSIGTVSAATLTLRTVPLVWRGIVDEDSLRTDPVHMVY